MEINNIKDTWYQVLQDPTRENFTTLVLKGTGEQNNLDFKEMWIKWDKLAEIMLAIANSGGGLIVIGIKENSDGTTDAVGLDKLKNKADVNNGISKYLPDTVSYDVYDFDYSGEEYSKLKDKKFQGIVIYSEEEKLPYLWNIDTHDNNIGVVFIRRGTKTCKANNTELQNLIDRRIRATYSDGSVLSLEEHLKQLKVLYNNIANNKTYFPFGTGLTTVKNYASASINGLDTSYPKETYVEFIEKMIEKKKIKIEKVLDLK